MAKLLSPFCLVLLLAASTNANANRYAYYVGFSGLNVIDTTNPGVVARIPGIFGDLAADPAGNFLYAVHESSMGPVSDIAVIDSNSRSIVATIPVANSSKLVISPTGKTLYALTASAVVVIDTSTKTVRAKVDLPQNPYGSDIAVLPASNKIYVSYGSPNAVIAIDASSNQVISTIQGISGRLAVDPTGNSVYVLAFAALSMIDTRTDSVIAKLALPSDSQLAVQIAFDPSGLWAYLAVEEPCGGFCFSAGTNGRVFVIDAAQHSIVATIPLPVVPTALTITPSGSRIYVSGEDPAANFHISGGVAVIDTASRSLLTTIPPPGTKAGSTQYIAMQPDGALVYVGYSYDCCAGSGQVTSTGAIGTDVIDTRTNTRIGMLPSSGSIIFKPDANPSSGGNQTQYTVQSSSGLPAITQWGQPGDVPMPADYDGDGRADIAIWRPSEGAWYIRRSSDGQLIYVKFASGTGTDAPIAADFDGDGRADAAIFYTLPLTVYAPQTLGRWLISGSATGLTFRQFGAPGDVPVPADYDGDGRADLAVWTPKTGDWSVLNSSDGSVKKFNWGVPDDIPVPRDFDGDGKTDFAIWRPSTATWWIVNSRDGSVTTFVWGVPGDIPVPRDFDGDGKADFAIWRPSTATWWIINSRDHSLTLLGWGAPGDIPVPADYDGDGRADPTVYRP
jgi:hypothetical protein